MQNDTIELHYKLDVACFIGTWIVGIACGFYLFQINKDVAFKRRWLPRFVILGGVLFVFFSSTIMVLNSRSFKSLPSLVFEIPFVALIMYLNIKFTKFCDKCGATVYDHNWFSPTTFCSKCGAELNATPKAKDGR